MYQVIVLALVCGLFVFWPSPAWAQQSESGTAFLNDGEIALKPEETKSIAVLTNLDPDTPVVVSVVAGEDTAEPVALTVSCLDEDGAAGDPDQTVACLGDAVRRISITAGSETGSALLVVTAEAAAPISRPLKVEKEPGPAVPLPKKLDLRLKSLGWFADPQDTVTPTVDFPVTDAPVSGIATGTAGETLVTLSEEDDKPQIEVKELTGYGDVAATLDANGAAEGGEIELTLHRRRAGGWAVLMLLIGSGLASLLALLQGVRDRNLAQSRYVDAYEAALAAYDSLGTTAAGTEDLNAATVREAWAVDRVIRPLDDKGQKTAGKVDSYVEKVETYRNCARLCEELIGDFGYFQRTADDRPITAAIRAVVQAGPPELGEAEGKLQSLAGATDEGRRLHALLTWVERSAPAERKADLAVAREGIVDISDLSSRAALNSGWAILYGAKPEVEEPTLEIWNRTLFQGRVVQPTRVESPLRVLMAREPAQRRASAAALLLSSKVAGFAALVLGFAIAVVLDYGSTFGANAGWGTNADMLAAVGKAFSVTGALQVARVLGAASSPK